MDTRKGTKESPYSGFYGKENRRIIEEKGIVVMHYKDILRKLIKMVREDVKEGKAGKVEDTILRLIAEMDNKDI